MAIVVQSKPSEDLKTKMTGTIGLSLGTVMEWGRRRADDTKAQPSQGDDAFGRQLSEALARSIDRASQSGAPVEITVQERQGDGAAAGSRQFVITVAPQQHDTGKAASGASMSTAAAPAAASSEPDRLPIIPAATTGSVFAMENPIPRVQQRMRELGLDFSGAQFELLDETVASPGAGQIVNHYLRVRTPNGWKEDFSVEYVLRNPTITAHEIAGMFRRPAAPAHLRYV